MTAASTPTVLLIVTGDMELLALGASLARYFEVVRFEKQKLNGTTTCRLRAPGAAPDVPAPMKKLAAAMFAGVTHGRAITKGRTEAPADFVFAIDDLEPRNLDQPSVVVEWVRRAMRAHIDASYADPRARERAAERVRARCSFHLFAPMPEAYFFGDPAAIETAGVKPETPRHVASPDLEDFLTDDVAYLAGGRAVERRRNGIAPERHPKDYIEHLCDVGAGSYDETDSGRRALERLDWRAILTYRERARFARALFEDLSDALQRPNPLPPGELHPATAPGGSTRSEGRVLRNL